MVLLMIFLMIPDLGIDNSAGSIIAFVMLTSFVSISVHSMFVISSVLCS